jgi:hypothetical protein
LTVVSAPGLPGPAAVTKMAAETSRYVLISLP